MKPICFALLRSKQWLLLSNFLFFIPTKSGQRGDRSFVGRTQFLSAVAAAECIPVMRATSSSHAVSGCRSTPSGIMPVAFTPSTIAGEVAPPEVAEMRLNAVPDHENSDDDDLSDEAVAFDLKITPLTPPGPRSTTNDGRPLPEGMVSLRFDEDSAPEPSQENAI